MSDDQKYMQIALAEAQKAADLGEIPIGAVLVIDGEMRSRLLFLIEEGEKTSNDAITLVSPKRKSSLPRRICW